MKDSGMFDSPNFNASPNKNAGKRGLSIGQPWSGGRPNDASHTRRSSNKDGVGPARPSAERPSSLFGRKEKSGN